MVAGTTDEIANLLWKARSFGGLVPIEAASGIDSIEAAYGVQRKIEVLAAIPRYGWKVGATSQEAQRVLDIDEPATAPMFASTCFQSPADVAVFSGQSASVESEFAFRFARDLPERPAPYSMDEVLDAVDALLPAIEVVGGRFEGGFIRIGPIRLIADMVAHTAFVSGKEITNWRGTDLRSHTVSLFRNGERVGEGTGSLVLGDPLLVLHWTANHLLSRGELIKAGQIVTTGTCTGITPVVENDVFIADFGTLGKVEVKIVPKSA